MPAIAYPISNIINTSLLDSYIYRGVEPPPTYKGPAAPSTTPQMQGDWTPDQALEQGWNRYQLELKNFFTMQAARNIDTTPSITPDSLTNSLTGNWETLLVIGGVVVAGVLVISKVIGSRR